MKKRIPRKVIVFYGKVIKFYLRTKYNPQIIPAYIHIPKTGGTYLNQLAGDMIPVIYPLKYLGHSYIIDDPLDLNVIYLRHALNLAKSQITRKEDINNYFNFSTVRNIFDWLVSYASFAAGWKYKNGNPSHYDYENAKKGFDYLIKTIANREDQWPSRKFIHCQIFSSKGDLVTNWLNRNETLDCDLSLLAQTLGIYYKKRKRQMVGKREDYREYYDDSLIDLVYKTWGRELKLFGFGFENSQIDFAILKKNIDIKTKQSIKYIWQKDLLLIDGMEIK